MGIPGLVIAFALGAAGLAVWCHVRFPGLAPESFRGAVVHIAAAVLLGQLALAPAQTMANDPTGILLVLFGLAVPALVYSFLSCLWMFRVCQELLGGAIR